MRLHRIGAPIALALSLSLLALPPGHLSLALQKPKDPPPANSSKAPPPKKAPSESDALQQAIDDAGNDRAALVRNLEAFLKDYPDSRQRPQIYRALVEACIQLQDSARAANYAERIVALKPEDISMTMLAIQLLERTGDEAALRRAMNYCSRVLDYIQRDSIEDKSPKISKLQWQTEHNRDEMNILNLRGGLGFKLKDYSSAQQDFQASMAISPSGVAGETLGEIAELHKDLPSAIREYARAFALSGNSDGGARRREIRQKLGNVWRLVHGSDAGLGDYVLRTYDDLAASSDAARPQRNASAKVPYEFVLRTAPDGSPFPLAAQKGKIVVLSFWATWCGPCRALEPHFERLSAEFQGDPGITFLAANCDEDESLVPAYLQEMKPHVPVVFADGLDRLLAVNAFPTVVILDRSGKIAYRAEGFDPDAVDAELRAAIRRVLGSQ